jgi:hypothetical protein
MAEEGFLANLQQGDFAGLGRNLWEGARDEWLGLDDFGRIPGKLSSGDFLGALKSLGAGTLELGGTALMFVPGGQIAALSKAGKLGKLAKPLNLMRPLSLAERSAAKVAGSRGIPRMIKEGINLGIGPELAEATTQKGFKKVLKGMTDEFGYGRGGVLGSLARGAGQVTGQIPASQGPLARGVLGGRVRAPFLSGKLGPLAMRTGVDTEIMEPFLGVPEAPVELPQTFNPELYALLALLQQQNSPGAAY